MGTIGAGRTIDAEAHEASLASAEEPEAPPFALPRFERTPEPEALEHPGERVQENPTYRPGYAPAAAHAFRVKGVAEKVLGPPR